MKKFLLLISLFIFSYSFSHAQSWLWGATCLGSSDTYGVATDGNGNAYLSGGFNGIISFGSYHLSSLNGDGYLAKYDSVGNILWAVQSKAAANNYSASINFNASDNYGNEYVVGYFAGTVGFGSFVLTSTSDAAFLVKYNKNGNVVWVKQSNTSDFHFWAVGESIATDKAGDIYVTGRFEGANGFGSDTVKSNSLSGDGAFFLVKYDSSGNVLWARQADFIPLSSPGIFVNSICTDNIGNAYITGTFVDTLIFNTDTLKCIPTIAGGYGDVFLVKYDVNGNVVWAKQSNIPSSKCFATGWSVITDKGNNTYLTGFFQDTIIFGSDTLKSNYSIQYGDVFLAKYNANGNMLWAKQSTHISSSFYGWGGYSVAVDTFDHLYMAMGGWYVDNGSVTFGNKTFSYTSSDIDPAVVMQLDTSGTVLCASSVVSGGDDQSTLAVDPTGKYAYWGGDLLKTIVFGTDTVYDAEPNTVSYEQPFIARWQPCYINQEPPANKQNEPCANLFIPDAFSPNKDGQNDILYVRSTCISTMDFVIFDRWGNKVFESQNLNAGWDGTYMGKPMNTGTYAYYLKGTMQDGTSINKHGNITLVR